MHTYVPANTHWTLQPENTFGSGTAHLRILIIPSHGDGGGEKNYFNCSYTSPNSLPHGSHKDIPAKCLYLKILKPISKLLFRLKRDKISAQKIKALSEFIPKQEKVQINDLNF